MVQGRGFPGQKEAPMASRRELVICIRLRHHSWHSRLVRDEIGSQTKEFMNRRRKKRNAIKTAATASAGKAKDVMKFVYKNRKEIMEVIALLGSLVALGKGSTRRRRKR